MLSLRKNWRNVYSPSREPLWLHCPTTPQHLSDPSCLRVKWMEKNDAVRTRKWQDLFINEWAIDSSRSSKLCKTVEGKTKHFSAFDIFLKNGPTLASFCLFLFFLQCNYKHKYSTNFTTNDSPDGVHGTRTRCHRMEVADESTELWRHPFDH